MITLTHYLIVAAALFSIGLYGVLTARSALKLIVCVELMLNAVNVNLAAFALHSADGPAGGLGFVIFLIVIAAAEVGVALAVVVSLSRTGDVSSIESFNELRG